MLCLLFVAIVLFVIADYTEYERRQKDPDYEKKLEKEIEDEYYRGLWRIKYGHYEYR